MTAALRRRRGGWPRAARAAVAFAAGAATPAAATESWTVLGSGWADCGGPCFVPPTAWTYDPESGDGLGIRCDGLLVIETARTVAQGDPASLAVDGRPLGRQVLLTDRTPLEVLPAHGTPAAAWAALRPALAAGERLSLTGADDAAWIFPLGGAAAALDALDLQCAADLALYNRSGADGSARVPTAIAFPPGTIFADGAAVDGWRQTGIHRWLGARPADGAELWLLTMANAMDDGLYVVAAAAEAGTGGWPAAWQVATSLHPPLASLTFRAPLTQDECALTADPATPAFARWDGRRPPDAAWTFDMASTAFVPLAPGAFVCTDRIDH
ncbi:MAG: hypothetical protein R3F55_25860 [Alphaproteobacteria bacterium]